jgi:hypothetical protein
MGHFDNFSRKPTQLIQQATRKKPRKNIKTAHNPLVDSHESRFTEHKQGYFPCALLQFPLCRNIKTEKKLAFQASTVTYL